MHVKHILNFIAGLAAGATGGVLLAFAAGLFIFGTFQPWIIPATAVIVAICYVATRALEGQPEERHSGAVHEPGTDINPHMYGTSAWHQHEQTMALQRAAHELRLRNLREND